MVVEYNKVKPTCIKSVAEHFTAFDLVYTTIKFGIFIFLTTISCDQTTNCNLATLLIYFTCKLWLISQQFMIKLCLVLKIFFLHFNYDLKFQYLVFLHAT